MGFQVDGLFVNHGSCFILVKSLVLQFKLLLVLSIGKGVLGSFKEIFLVDFLSFAFLTLSSSVELLVGLFDLFSDFDCLRFFGSFNDFGDGDFRNDFLFLLFGLSFSGLGVEDSVEN